jgi:hypothetical protein
VICSNSAHTVQNDGDGPELGLTQFHWCGNMDVSRQRGASEMLVDNLINARAYFEERSVGRSQGEGG